MHTAVEVTKEAALFISRLFGDTERAGADPGLREEGVFLTGDRLLLSGERTLPEGLRGEFSEVPAAFLFFAGVGLLGEGLPISP